MEIYLTWVLILTSFHGGMLKVENIASFEDCERLRIRAEIATNGTSARYTNGACTQIRVFVPKASTVITVPQQPAPIVKNTVVVRK